jgi:hypothetical protein
MPDVKLPDGSIARFPAGTAGEDIEAALRQQFPPPRPTSIALGEKAQRANGYVTHSAQCDRFMVYDNSGKLHGLRTSLEAALDLADSIKPPPPPRRQPKTEPEPEPEPLDPIAAGYRIGHEIDRAIRRQEAQNRRDDRRSWQKRRHRNRGTLDR